MCDRLDGVGARFGFAPTTAATRSPRPRTILLKEKRCRARALPPHMHSTRQTLNPVHVLPVGSTCRWTVRALSKAEVRMACAVQLRLMVAAVRVELLCNELHSVAFAQ